MPTLKQRKAFKLVANGSSMRDVMKKAGYSKNTAIAPTKLTNSLGFKELCEEVGLTDQLITSALTSDIISKPKNRVAELTLGARIKGLLKNDEPQGQQIVIHISNEIAQQNYLIKEPKFNATNNTNSSPGKDSIR